MQKCSILDLQAWPRTRAGAPPASCPAAAAPRPCPELEQACGSLMESVFCPQAGDGSLHGIPLGHQQQHEPICKSSGAGSSRADLGSHMTEATPDGSTRPVLSQGAVQDCSTFCVSASDHIGHRRPHTLSGPECISKCRLGSVSSQRPDL